MTTQLIAAIEAGGTKFICAVGTSNGEVLAQRRVDTRAPEETLAEVLSFFEQSSRSYGPIQAAGIASFGPLDLDTESPECGSIVSTPKPGWSGVNIQEVIRKNLGVATVIDTDVNCAALAEGKFGAAQGCDNFCYMTVGTGIGVGAFVAEKPISGRANVEIGHMRVPRAKGDDFVGRCPYHGDCLEGLACGPAIADRWGRPAEQLPEDHPAWDIEAYYIAAACHNLIYMMRPQRIIIGGGVFERKSLFPRVRSALQELLQGYALSSVEQNLDTMIVPPDLTDTPPGLIGAFQLAQVAEGLRREGRYVG